MDTQLSNPFVMWQNTRLPCLLLLWNTSIWSPLISLHLAGHRCTTSRFFQLPASKAAAHPLCSCSPIFDPPLPLQKPSVRGSQLLTQEGNSIASRFVSDNQSISREQVQRDVTAYPAPPPLWKGRAPAQHRHQHRDWTWNGPARLASKYREGRKGCERAWGRERARSQASSRWNKAAPRWPVPLFSPAPCGEAERLSTARGFSLLMRTHKIGTNYYLIYTLCVCVQICSTTFLLG